MEFIGDNDTFLIYTDGLSESTNDNGEMFGYERLIKIMEQCSGFSTEKIVSEIRTKLDVHIGDLEYSDDLLIMAIRILT